MNEGDARTSVVSQLLNELQNVRPNDRALIAIDGFDGAGKTHLAQELIELATRQGGRPLARASIDGFHRPKAERLRAGSGPEGFYRGSYRYDTFRECVTTPLRSGEAIVPAVWDVARDQPVTVPEISVPASGILIVDGIFLHRRELVDVWDATVWVDAPFAVTVPRGNARFQGRHDDDPDALSNLRYVDGQRLYVSEAAPKQRATWVFDNTDLARPRLRRNRM